MSKKYLRINGHPLYVDKATPEKDIIVIKPSVFGNFSISQDNKVFDAKYISGVDRGVEFFIFLDDIPRYYSPVEDNFISRIFVGAKISGTW